MKRNILSIFTALTMLLPMAQTVFAQENTIGDLNVVRANQDVGVQSIGRLLSAFFTVAVIVAAVFVFAMLIIGGYGWITAGGDKAKVEEARTRITNAIIGLAIVASAWALVTVIGNFFGVNITNITIPKATGPNSGEGFGNSGL